MKTKICTRCRTRKAVASFFKHKGRKDGYAYWCKKCVAAHENENPAYKEKQRQREIVACKKYYDRHKLAVFNHYCPQGICCAKCGFSDIRALSIDHINGGGVQHIKQIGGGGIVMYRWLIHNNFPQGFQILCMNCNFIKRHENDETKRSNVRY